MKIIDTENGDFLLIEKIIINKTTTYSELRNLFPDNDYWEVGTGYFWIYFQNIIVEKQNFYADICFRGEQLHMIIFGFRDIYEKAFSWEDFDEKIELQKKKSYEKWLIKTLGGTEFPWGKVNALYNPKSSFSGMVLTYNQ